MLHFANNGTGINVVAVLDPLSKDAQKLIPILMVCEYVLQLLFLEFFITAFYFSSVCFTYLCSNIYVIQNCYSKYLKVLRNITEVNLKIYMNCREKLSELPLKRSYFNSFTQIIKLYDWCF